MKKNLLFWLILFVTNQRMRKSKGQIGDTVEGSSEMGVFGRIKSNSMRVRDSST